MPNSEDAFIEAGRLMALGYEMQLTERGLLEKEAMSLAPLKPLATKISKLDPSTVTISKLPTPNVGIVDKAKSMGGQVRAWGAKNTRAKAGIIGATGVVGGIAATKGLQGNRQ